MYISIGTRVKTLNLFPVDENRLQQCCAAPHEQCCQQHVATLLGTTRCNNIVDNNVHGVQRGCSTTLLRPVLIDREQVERFWPCIV